MGVESRGAQNFPQSGTSPLHFLFTHTLTHTHAHKHIHMHTKTCARAHLCTHAHACICTHTHTDSLTPRHHISPSHHQKGAHAGKAPAESPSFREKAAAQLSRVSRPVKSESGWCRPHSSPVLQHIRFQFEFHFHEKHVQPNPLVLPEARKGPRARKEPCILTKQVPTLLSKTRRLRMGDAGGQGRWRVGPRCLEILLSGYSVPSAQELAEERAKQP